MASSGGHWVQLRRLAPAYEGFDLAYASVLDDLAEEVGEARFYRLENVTRFNLRGLLVLVPQAMRLVLKERPDVVISTGALPGLITLALAKILVRSRTIWIDSIANVERMSSSGMAARWFTDHWLSQWPEVAKATGAEHWGGVI